MSFKENKFCFFAISVFFVFIQWNTILASNNTSVLPRHQSSEAKRYIVLDGNKTFSEQLVHTDAIYVIRDEFDLRTKIIGLRIDKTFTYNNHKYYRNRAAISLQAGQGIWVPRGVVLFDKALKNILSKNGFYISEKTDSLFLCTSKATTIDYLLSGVVTMPEGCVLKFEGGCLSKGIIRSVRTQIQAPVQQIFGDNMYFRWYWDIEEAYPEWFGAKGDRKTDDGLYIQKCIDSFKKAKLTNHVYYSSKTIYVSSHSRLEGNGRFQTSIVFTGSINDMICSSSEETSTELVISRINLSKVNKNLSIKNGIHIYSSTGSRIEFVGISDVEVGFALNSYFGSQLIECKAYNCDIGFYLGSEGGNSTSVDYDNCYAINCMTGHLFRRCSYVTTKNTSADFCETAYDFIESCVTLVSPGAEGSKFFVKLIQHSDISSTGNYAHNNVHIINGQSIANEPNTDGVIYISTDTRGYNDRNRIQIDGFNVYFKTHSSDNKLLFKSGDSVLHLNDLTSDVQPNIEAINYYRDGAAVLQRLSTLKYWSDKVVGISVFIKELNKPVFWNGSNWVDAVGAKML